MTQEPIKYKDVMALGFEHKDEPNDRIFREQRGYDYFIVTKELNKTIIETKYGPRWQEIIAEWDIEDRTVRIIRCVGEGDVISEKLVRDLDELRAIVHFYTSTENVAMFEHNYSQFGWRTPW